MKVHSVRSQRICRSGKWIWAIWFLANRKFMSNSCCSIRLHANVASVNWPALRYVSMCLQMEVIWWAEAFNWDIQIISIRQRSATALVIQEALLDLTIWDLGIIKKVMITCAKWNMSSYRRIKFKFNEILCRRFYCQSTRAINLLL